MKHVLVIVIIFIVSFAFANDANTILDDMQKEVVKQQTEKTEDTIPTINSTKHIDKQPDKSAVTFSISHKNCLAQGYTQDECININKNNTTTNPYDIKNPKMPSVNEAKDDLFINIQIKH